MIRVFLCGAHSTGKTTLLNRLLKESDNDLYGETEVARKVIADLGWQKKDFEPKENPDNFFELQARILQAQSEVDKRNTELQRSYISDRGIDPLIYCRVVWGEKRLNELLRADEAKECIARHEAANTLTVVLDPHPECIKEDGMRLTPVMDELNKFTDLLKDFLRVRGIEFKTIKELDLEIRVSMLKNFIKNKRNSVRDLKG